MSLDEWVRTSFVRRREPRVRSRRRPALHPALRETLAACAASGSSVYLFGANATKLYDLRDLVYAEFPDLRLAGLCDADFAGPISREIFVDIASRRPDLLIVDVPAAMSRQLKAQCARLAPGVRIVYLRHSFGADGAHARAWRNARVYLRFGVIVIRQKLGLVFR